MTAAAMMAARVHTMGCVGRPLRVLMFIPTPFLLARGGRPASGAAGHLASEKTSGNPSCGAGFREREYMDAVAGRGKYGVGDGRPYRRHARLSYAGRWLGRRHDVYFHLRHFVDAQYSIVIEVVLF